MQPSEKLSCYHRSKAELFSLGSRTSLTRCVHPSTELLQKRVHALRDNSIRSGPTRKANYKTEAEYSS